MLKYALIFIAVFSLTLGACEDASTDHPGGRPLSESEEEAPGSRDSGRWKEVKDISAEDLEAFTKIIVEAVMEQGTPQWESEALSEIIAASGMGSDRFAEIHQATLKDHLLQQQIHGLVYQELHDDER